MGPGGLSETKDVKTTLYRVGSFTRFFHWVGTYTVYLRYSRIWLIIIPSVNLCYLPLFLFVFLRISFEIQALSVFAFFRLNLS